MKVSLSLMLPLHLQALNMMEEFLNVAQHPGNQLNLLPRPLC